MNSVLTSSVYNTSEMGIRVFRHEIGHALKMAHPIQNGSLKDHNYNGYPIALMNQKSVNGGSTNVVSQWVTNHDKYNLIKKWGN